MRTSICACARRPPMRGAGRAPPTTRVAAVLYPGLPHHPGHAVAGRQMQRRLRRHAVDPPRRPPGGRDRRRGAGESVEAGDLVGGVESLIEHRASIEGRSSPCPPICCACPPGSRTSTTCGAISTGRLGIAEEFGPDCSGRYAARNGAEVRARKHLPPRADPFTLNELFGCVFQSLLARFPQNVAGFATDAFLGPPGRLHGFPCAPRRSLMLDDRFRRLLLGGRSGGHS